MKRRLLTLWWSLNSLSPSPLIAACERLILLTNDANELRDYSILLYHCGLYEESLQYLKKYREPKLLQDDSSTKVTSSSNSQSSLEEVAVDKLMACLSLI